MTPRQQIITALIAAKLQRNGTIDTIEEWNHVVKLADRIIADPDPTANANQDPTKGDYTQAIIVLEQEIDDVLQHMNLGKSTDVWKERLDSCQAALALLKQF